MSQRRLFTKSYESFVEKVAMGTIGVRRALEVLRSQGHNPLAIEKGTMSFKVWISLKVKRFRVPDLLCLKCGRRFEVRSKTKPEISMSHSLTNPDRAWYYGLNDDDYVVFIVCKKTGSEPIKWKAVGPIYYVLVKDLQNAFNNGQYFMSSKGKEEGFEKRVIWPTKFASNDGKVLDIKEDYIEMLVGNRRKRIPLYMKRGGKEVKLKPLVKKGEAITKGMAIASVVDIVTQVPCDKSVSVDHYINLLSSSSRVDRFIAAKALRNFDDPTVRQVLRQKLYDKNEEKLVLYEVAVSLLNLNDNIGRNYIDFIINKNGDMEVDIHEILISLSEANPNIAFPIIKNVLTNPKLPVVVRATAAWALGELGIPEAFDELINSFNSMDIEVKKEAARALLQIFRKHEEAVSDKVFEKFKVPNQKHREGLSWVLGKILRDRLEEYFQDVLNLVVDEDSKIWVSYILGVQDPKTFSDTQKELIRSKDKEVFFAANVLWVVLKSWIWGLEEW
ncbi:MAG: hypothetical protein LM590_12785 [Thermofilum sp.]|jgi:hypothetical protein|nr:hypothetical protein [Thermofilum sp.]